jgi:hypothetical protein
MGKLTALRVKNAKPGDKLSDGDGLRLDVDKNGNASWIFRFTSPTKVHEKGKNKGDPRERFMGLGANSCPWQLSNFVFIPEMILKSGRFNVPPVPRATRAITPTWRRR